MVAALDAALNERLRSVLEGCAATEAELRKLLEQGRASARLVRARLEATEVRLAELSADPASALSELASTLREVHELRPQLDELEASLARLDERAREVRRSWVAAG